MAFPLLTPALRLVGSFLRAEKQTVRVAAAVTESEAVMAVDLLLAAGIEATSLGSPHRTGGSPWGSDAELVGIFGDGVFYIWVRVADVDAAQNALKGTTVALLAEPR